jgi:predicted transcriptional regulator
VYLENSDLHLETMPYHCLIMDYHSIIMPYQIIIMDYQFIEIEQLAANANKGVSTIRRYLKNLSKEEKSTYIKKIPIIKSGGEKFLYRSDLMIMLSQKNDNAFSNNDNNVIQEQIPDNVIIELLKKQIEDKSKEIEHRNKQLDMKDTQISNLSEANKELIERLKEVNYTLANAQKQLAAPVDNEQTTPPKWWQFWK